MRRFRCLAPLLVAFASPLASAQNANVLVVDAAGGPGSAFTDIQPAINAAANGDIVLVRSGSYAGFEVQAKSVSIVADAGASVVVNSASTIKQLGDDQRVEVMGVTLTPIPQALGQSLLPLDVTSCAGVVWLERVTATAQWNASFPSVSGLRVANCASVTLLRCTFQASIPGGFAGPSGAPGLDVSNSTLAIYDGEL